MSILNLHSTVSKIGLGFSIFTLIGLSQLAAGLAITYPFQDSFEISQLENLPPTVGEPSSGQEVPVTELPEDLVNQLLTQASQDTGLPVSELEIVRAQSVVWRDGCLGINYSDRACTMALVPGWRIFVQGNAQTWIYHTGGSRFILAISLPITELPDPWPGLTGTSQDNPILPTITDPNVWSFKEVPSGLWYDPPTVFGFQYKVTSKSLFTEILDFPTDFQKPFTVLVKDILLGEFTAGNQVNFSEYSSLLGDLLVAGTGVEEFSITGLNVDPSNPAVFPLKLDFNTDTVSFNMYALTENSSAENVPEPSSIFGTLVGILFLGSCFYQRKRKQTLNFPDHPKQ